MKYRAILNDPGDSSRERPKQVMTNSRPEIDRWTKLLVLATAISPDAVVSIYETFEQQIGIVQKAKL